MQGISQKTCLILKYNGFREQKRVDITRCDSTNSCSPVNEEL